MADGDAAFSAFLSEVAADEAEAEGTVEDAAPANGAGAAADWANLTEDERKRKAADHKAKGNALFKAGDNLAAVDAYTLHKFKFISKCFGIFDGYHSIAADLV